MDKTPPSFSRCFQISLQWFSVNPCCLFWDSPVPMSIRYSYASFFIPHKYWCHTGFVVADGYSCCLSLGLWWHLVIISLYMLLMAFMVCLFCFLDALCLWVERVWLGKSTRLWTAATAILAELDKEIGLKSNLGHILCKWKNGDNIQVLLTTKATFFLLRLKKKNHPVLTITFWQSKELP